MQVAIFYTNSLTYEAEHTFLPNFICVFSNLSHVDVWIREYGLCVTSFLYPSETRSYGLLFECSLIQIKFKKENKNEKMLQLHFVQNNV